jgi:hypothetical protein
MAPLSKQRVEIASIGPDRAGPTSTSFATPHAHLDGYVIAPSCLVDGMHGLMNVADKMHCVFQGLTLGLVRGSASQLALQAVEPRDDAISLLTRRTMLGGVVALHAQSKPDQAR